MNKKWSFAIAGVLALSSLTGCASSSAGPKNAPHTQNIASQKPAETRSSIAHDHKAYTQGTNAILYRNGYTTNGFNQNIAEQFTRVADDVPGVERATVVVNGQDAVIGIRIRQNLAPEQAKVIEQQVHSAARAVSPSMNIRVTSEPAMFTRIRGINDAIYNEAQNRTNNVHNVPSNVAHNVSNTVNDFGILLKDLGRTVTAPFHR
ncbi:YhcN/YlaJ family sporulation lipoprotein [Brevibacillus choshinensis]|uniref:YhcN/YlaJ family sporulation lipoprotein n=1 Tax=Brevibacillus choshinensis TaxID=54911 RepID=UPI002E1CCA88|nr:YhcN/YlaJ family sporulation lipoprotein [Brevibacillus choshinensis]MED4752162.1 YhcN/YlaJ family sporulation lipoprotein [Brevibacillus choshinensis]MED4784593.1 YhcN/YlaJ family sporulation lipoprotein [Brevibacillus choshinensis]